MRNLRTREGRRLAERQSIQNPAQTIEHGVPSYAHPFLPMAAPSCPSQYLISHFYSPLHYLSDFLSTFSPLAALTVLYGSVVMEGIRLNCSDSKKGLERGLLWPSLSQNQYSHSSAFKSNVAQTVVWNKRRVEEMVLGYSQYALVTLGVTLKLFRKEEPKRER